MSRLLRTGSAIAVIVAFLLTGTAPLFAAASGNGAVGGTDPTLETAVKRFEALRKKPRKLSKVPQEMALHLQRFNKLFDAAQLSRAERRAVLAELGVSVT